LPGIVWGFKLNILQRTAIAFLRTIGLECVVSDTTYQFNQNVTYVRILDVNSLLAIVPKQLKAHEHSTKLLFNSF